MDAIGEARTQARGAGERLRRTTAYRVLVAVGLVSYGIVHLLIAGIALRVAWGGGGGQADDQGALRTLANAPAGPLVLVIVAIGLLTLVLWQAIEAGFGHGRVARQHDERKRTLKRVSSAGRAVVYLALAASAIRLVAGAGGGGNTEESATGRLLTLPFGRALVVLVAAAVVAIGVTQVVRGLKRKFTEDLQGSSRPAEVLGSLGFTAKGVSLVVVGALFGWAALTADPDKAGGLDQALQTIGSQPFGSILLTVVALGFVAFGLYCFVWARRAEV